MDRLKKIFRPSQVPKIPPETPPGQIIASDEEEYAVEGGMEESLVGYTTDGRVTGLGSDLPEAPDEALQNENFLSSPLQTFESPRERMGAELSTEVNGNLHEARDELLKDIAVPPKTTGKLKRPASKLDDQTAAKKQRTLAGANKVRPNVYEADGSPEDAPRLARRPGRPTKDPQISPIRAQRRNPPGANSRPTHENRTPRKSKRQQDLPPEVDPHVNAHSARAQAQGAEYEEGQDMADDEQAEAEDGADVDAADGIGAAEPREDATNGERSAQITTQQKGGRPRKSQKTGKPGRPPKKGLEKSGDQLESAAVGPAGNTVRNVSKRGEATGTTRAVSNDNTTQQKRNQKATSIRTQNALPNRRTAQTVPPRRTVAANTDSEWELGEEENEEGEDGGGEGVDDVDEENGEDELEADRDGEATRPRLFGQWQNLQKVVNALDDIGWNTENGKKTYRNRISLKDKDIKKIVDLCTEATRRCTALVSHAGSIEGDTDPATVLEEISERVDGLRGKNADFPTDFRSKKKSASIYCHAIPGLCRLLQHAARCYLRIDANVAPAKQIQIRHLRIITEIMRMITDLCESVKQYEKPDTDLHVVRPVRNTVYPTLRNMLKAFSWVIENHEYDKERASRQQEEVRLRALRLEQEERESRQLARIHKFQDKWRQLHDERMWAEGGIMLPRKRKHLEIPTNPSYSHTELDQNGQPFSREEGFVPRVGPTPGMIDAANSVEWTATELNALWEGLKQYAGPNVFERVFRRYCPNGRELNKYNVTQIVTTAANIRDGMIAHQKSDEEQGGVVDQWVLDIPVWTRGKPLPEKENDDSLVGLTRDD